MHIYFIGQKGISPKDTNDINEARVEALSQELLAHGHRVTVPCTGNYCAQSPMEMRGLRTIQLPSLNPNIAGGWLYIALSCLAVLFTKHVNTIHVHGWKGALLVRPLLVFMPRLQAVWTIPTMPLQLEPLQHSLLKRAVPFIASGFSRICTPSRTTQYQLLARYNLETQYIPDGYTTPSLPDVRPATFGLRKEQYGIVFSATQEELKTIVKAYRKLKTKKKLVVFADKAPTGAMAINLPLLSRGAISLIRQTGFIVSTNPTYAASLLQAMDTGRNIFATTTPLHQELLGRAATYFSIQDPQTLQNALTEATGAPRTYSTATLRSQKLFSWERIAQEYTRLYSPAEPVLVPFDSIIPRQGFKIAG